VTIDQIWYEDVEPGLVLVSPARVITADAIDRFAELTGERHPLHMDDDFAHAAGFPGRIAHALFTLAVMEGLKSRLGCFERSAIASKGWDKVRFRAPLLPGESVTLRLEMVDKRVSARPGQGVALERAALIKDGGGVVTTGEQRVVILMRPA